MLFMAVGVADVNPLFFVFSIVAAHGALVVAGFKEPHLSTMLQAYGQTNKISKNLYAVEGNKFEP